MMRVSVALIAGAERQTRVPGPAIGSRQVAFLAGHLPVQPGQGITGPAVIEFRAGNGKSLPVIEAVALQAVLPQTALMLVLVAGHAGWRQS